MKQILCLFILTLTGLQAFACDDTCKKQTTAKYGVEFAGYLNRKYCSDISIEFMTTTLKSLQSYRFKHLESKHRGGMKNTSRFIKQREEWLQECDQYLSLTKQGRVFKDDKTTGQIMAALKAVSKELESLVKGVTYASDGSRNSTTVAAEKFDKLFTLIDNHKTLLQLRGQFVTR